VLTGAGRAALVVGVTCYAAGVALAYPELSAFGAVLLVLVFVALLFLLRRPRLAVTREVAPRRVARGDAAVGLLQVTNVGTRSSTRVTALDRVGAAVSTLELPALGAGRGHTATYRLDTSRRGVYDVGPLVVVQSDPLSLAARDRAHGDVVQLIVHPRVHALRTPTGVLHDLEGPAADTAAEGSITFQSLREYVVGDDLRQVHWRTTARTGTLMVRQHVDTSRPETLVLLDDRLGRYADDAVAEEAVDVAASVIAATVGARFPARLRTVVATASVHADGDVAPVFDALAALHLVAAADASRGVLGDAVRVALAGDTAGGSMAAFVTGRIEAGDVAELAALRAAYRVVVVLCVDPEQPSAAVEVGSGVRTMSAATAAELAGLWNAQRSRR
jgi:uncharacterized protein (DUF58 family)